MSAQYGAPGVAHAQIGRPTYSPGPRAPRRTPRARAMAVAAATLGAPALAIGVLGALGAVGGGEQPGLGAISGTQGLEGSAVPTPAPDRQPEPTREKVSKQTSQNPRGAAKPDAHRAKAPADPAPAKPQSPSGAQPGLGVGRRGGYVPPPSDGPGSLMPDQGASSGGSMTSGSAGSGTSGSGTGSGSSASGGYGGGGSGD
jgi:hypothetical protein